MSTEVPLIDDEVRLQERDYEAIGRRRLLARRERIVVDASGADILAIGHAASGILITGETTTISAEAFKRAFADLKCTLSNSAAPGTFAVFTPYTAPTKLPAPSAANIAEHFNQLVSEWKRDTLHSSRIDEMISHPSYRKIIALGQPALPLILAELERNGGYWFTALSEITHHNPNATNLKDLASAWIEWGRKHGATT